MTEHWMYIKSMTQTDTCVQECANWKLINDMVCAPEKRYGYKYDLPLLHAAVQRITGLDNILEQRYILQQRNVHGVKTPSNI